MHKIACYYSRTIRDALQWDDHLTVPDALGDDHLTVPDALGDDHLAVPDALGDDHLAVPDALGDDHLAVHCRNDESFVHCILCLPDIIKCTVSS